MADGGAQHISGAIPSCLSLESSEPSQAFPAKILCGDQRLCAILRATACRRPEKGLRVVGTAQPPAPEECPCQLGPTFRHFCPCVHGPRNSQAQGASKAGSGCQGSGTSPRVLGQLRWLPVKASKGCAKQAGGPGCTGLPETEMGEQKEAMVGRFGGSPWRQGGGDRGRAAVSSARCRQLEAASRSPRCGPCTVRNLRPREDRTLAGGGGLHRATACICQESRRVS